MTPIARARCCLRRARRLVAALLFGLLGLECTEVLLEAIGAEPGGVAVVASAGTSVRADVSSRTDVVPRSEGPGPAPRTTVASCVCAQAVSLASPPIVASVLVAVQVPEPTHDVSSAPPSPPLERALRPPASATA